MCPDDEAELGKPGNPPTPDDGAGEVAVAGTAKGSIVSGTVGAGTEVLGDGVVAGIGARIFCSGMGVPGDGVSGIVGGPVGVGAAVPATDLAGAVVTCGVGGT